MRTAAGVVAAALVLGGCGGGGTDAGAVCGPVVHPEAQGGGHVIGDREPPVPYSSTPGTSGFHAAGAPRTGVIDPGRPLSEPEIVSALEAGQVVAAYDPEGLPEDEVDALAELATGPLDGRLTVTPFDGDMGATLTLNAWGTRQPCSAVEAEAVRAFVEEHGDEPVPHEG